MSSTLDVVLTASFWAATLRICAPLLFGTLGELICERAGVLNLGIEGIMTAGALSGWLTVYYGADLWTGVCVAALVGAIFGLLHGFLTVPLGLSQHVTGIGISLLGASLSYFSFRLLIASTATPTIKPFSAVRVPLLADIPLVGPVLFEQSPLVYLAFSLAIAVSYILYRTPLGLAVRMVGENAMAADAQGVSVVGIRMAAVVVGSAIMAIGGAFLTLSAFNAFFVNLVNGRGWICIALVVFSSWKPARAIVASLFFASLEALQIRLQQGSGGLPYQFFLMLPYLLSIVALIAVARRVSGPQSLMVPFRRGER
ncbi:ABC transporter permease [Bradyrhizobium manausense]|uniref:ABC transporter permease n=1 Tax=Bradyrhizobium manausense TaxID=989370 RepID=A0A0R3E6T3_9BRAD|nr:ABC transporter permease [Bradyrhizobium manausense]KRQ15796.1 ABC transporter permease [Bradyrhizobium manausense]